MLLIRQKNKNMITADQVKKLRKDSNLSVMECKKALEEAGGDFAKAKKLLQKIARDSAEKKSTRKVGQGIVEAYIHSNERIGAMVELYCETDFVAKSKEFKDLAHDLAMQVAATNPSYLRIEDVPAEWQGEEKKEICLYTQTFIKNPDQSVEDYIKEKIAKLGENIKVGEFVRFEV